jgi:Zinc finger C-x8-C-x5-C-x3-H type (and similar)
MPEQPAERINPYFVVDTGFVAPSRGNVCYEFQRSGRCSKGAACRFTHGDDISNAGVTPGAGQAGAVAPRADAKPWLSNAVSVVRCALPRTFDARLFFTSLDSSCLESAARTGRFSWRQRLSLTLLTLAVSENTRRARTSTAKSTASIASTASTSTSTRRSTNTRNGVAVEAEEPVLTLTLKTVKMTRRRGQTW